jgi:hypothetical protein
MAHPYSKILEMVNEEHFVLCFNTNTNWKS